VNGEVIVRSDSFVTCALRPADEAERRGKAWASFEEGWSVRADEEIVSWNWSIRMSVVDRRAESCLDILKGVVRPRWLFAGIWEKFWAQSIKVRGAD
jgi:hypothetical protein